MKADRGFVSQLGSARANDDSAAAAREKAPAAESHYITRSGPSSVCCAGWLAGPSGNLAAQLRSAVVGLASTESFRSVRWLGEGRRRCEINKRLGKFPRALCREPVIVGLAWRLHHRLMMRSGATVTALESFGPARGRFPRRISSKRAACARSQVRRDKLGTICKVSSQDNVPPRCSMTTTTNWRRLARAERLAARGSIACAAWRRLRSLARVAHCSNKWWWWWWCARSATCARFAIVIGRRHACARLRPAVQTQQAASAKIYQSRGFARPAAAPIFTSRPAFRSATTAGSLTSLRDIGV